MSGGGLDTPQRITRSKSSQPPASPTAPGPPVPVRDTSKQAMLNSASGGSHSCNPFDVDLVIPYDISSGKEDRLKAQEEIREGYEGLLRALEGEGLRIATRPGRAGKGKEEIWVFVSASAEKIRELVERESLLDQSHNLPPHPHSRPPTRAARIRLLYSLLTAPGIQNGLGITPGDGKWKRVKSIAALHDEDADKAWVEQWTTGGDWQIGLTKGLSDGADTGLGEHQPPPVHLYFEFLTTYTRSLLPLSIISAAFYLLSPADSYPPLFALILCLYSTIFVAYWRIRERKLAVRWGTRGCESVAVGRLRPEYVANLGLDKRAAATGLGGEEAVDAVQAGDELKRDVKVALSVPVIAACGVGLGVVLMGIFLLEAFVAQVYQGAGKEVVPLVPTALFALLVPQLVGLYHTLSKWLVKWEDHPTPVGSEKSLTAKTFAMNGIVAYLGLFLSAYIYVPFGPFIMGYIQDTMAKHSGGTVQLANTPEKAGLGPRTSVQKQHEIKSGRLKSQLFAYTVTNQAVNTFLELGLPFILRFVNDWRRGKASLKDLSKNGHKQEGSTADADPEKRFLDRVENQLGLPDYSTFTDYAEMVTQFGYITVWSIVWPIAPVFAFINNYIELRSDALKICKHVRQPIGDRVETIGSWLDTMASTHYLQALRRRLLADRAQSIISWIGAVTNATLIYLFRPGFELHDHDHPSHHLQSHGSAHLATIVSAYSSTHSTRALLPTLIPLGLVALAASHGWFVLRWIVDAVAERTLWRGSPEEVEVQRMTASSSKRVEQKLEKLDGLAKKVAAKSEETTGGVFWNGGEEGAREIARVGKAE